MALKTSKLLEKRLGRTEIIAKIPQQFGQKYPLEPSGVGYNNLQIMVGWRWGGLGAVVVRVAGFITTYFGNRF